MIDTVLIVIALICFALAFFNVNARGYNLIAAGLFAWALAALV